MPKLLSFPERFGISRSRAGSGRYVPLLSSWRNSSSTRSTPICSTCLRVLAIDTGGPRPRVAFHPLPRNEQRRGVADQVKQIAEASLLILACPSAQLGLPSQYPLLRELRVKRRERIHARPPEQRFMLRSCCPPSPCGRLSRPRTTTRTPTRATPISQHRALPDRHQQPGGRGRLPRSP
jgi:hypothetical protein